MTQVTKWGIWLALVGMLCPAMASAEEPVDIGSRLELFVDRYMVDELKGNAELRLHSPQPQEIAIRHEEPWEGTGCGYHSVFKDGDIYRMYYKSWEHSAGEGTQHPNFTGYAESKDGKEWVKPNVGIVEFEGSTDNNIVLTDDMFEGMTINSVHPAVFLDTNPDCPPDARIKAVTPGSPRGLYILKSGDGLHFEPMSKAPVITDGAFDSQNLAFWDPVREEYRAYWRDFKDGSRTIKTATSDDCLNWTEPQWLDYMDAPNEQLYVNQIMPYYRAPHIFIGFPARYFDRGWSDSMRQLPQLEHREKRASSSERYGTAITDSLLMSSRDGLHFYRWPKTFVRPGPQKTGNWVYGDNYIAWHVVETESDIEGAPKELSLYISENYWRLPGSRMRRHTLRIDGFVSVQADRDGGEMITRPVTFDGDELHLNMATSVAGDIRVELQDPSGKPYEGYALEDCPPIFGDFLDRVVSWEGGSDVSSLAGKPVRMRVVLKEADLYSFQFE